ncbi:MAG: hypothetical protein HOH74_13190 [Gemmatimonadetes bacterium]|jgi:hypothetical protein|nr:hypothetical protein [Gemmatimonadota bacterium]
MMKKHSIHILFGVVVLVALGCARWPQSIQPGGDELATSGLALAAYLEARDVIGVDEPGEAYQPWVVVLPFEDDSGFHEGVFDLPNDIPHMLADVLSGRGICRVVPPEAVADVMAGRGYNWAEEHLESISDTLRADHIITGALLDYNFERLTVGDPLLGGYKSYVGTAEIEAELRGGGQGLIGTAHSRKETQNRGLGLDLLGKPREGDRQFVELGSMEFGGEEFRETAIGEATVLVLDAIVARITHLLQPQRLFGMEGAPKVLSVFGTEIFINAGNENGVKKGYRFTIQTAPDTVPAIVEVVDIIGASVSRVTALRGGNQIEAGQTLTLIGVKDTIDE